MFIPAFKGTIIQKFKELNRIQSQIVSLKEAGVRSSDGMDKLLRERAEYEVDIDRHLLNGEHLENRLMEYCLRNFRGGQSNVNGETTYHTVFDVVPSVELFRRAISGHIGHKILNVYGDSYAETGVIKGASEFQFNNKGFRYLFVPVNNLSELGKKGWKAKKLARIQINSDLFQHPKGTIFGGHLIWETDHSNITHVGGSGPEETAFYIGNDVVERRLEKGFDITIPARTVRISAMPKYR